MRQARVWGNDDYFSEAQGRGVLEVSRRVRIEVCPREREWKPQLFEGPGGGVTSALTWISPAGGEVRLLFPL